jgi:ankyrin repeat protein
LKRQNGWSPLHFSAEGGHVDACRALISDGADVNRKTDVRTLPPTLLTSSQREITPLYLAIAGRHVEAAELLISKGARVVDMADVRICHCVISPEIVWLVGPPFRCEI